LYGKAKAAELAEQEKAKKAAAAAASAVQKLRVGGPAGINDIDLTAAGHKEVTVVTDPSPEAVMVALRADEPMAISAAVLDLADKACSTLKMTMVAFKQGL
jgi:hypothetical protein